MMNTKTSYNVTFRQIDAMETTWTPMKTVFDRHMPVPAYGRRQATHAMCSIFAGFRVQIATLCDIGVCGMTSCSHNCPMDKCGTCAAQLTCGELLA
jgi:hypothetical protein